MASHHRAALNGRRLGAIAAVALLVFSGCASLKRFSYSGVDRDRWQHPEDVIRALELRPGESVADLGSGGAYFTFRLADAVGKSGKVYAVDIDKGLLDDLAARASRDGYANVVTVLADRDDPKLPKDGIDLIFTSNTYHHLNNHTDYFRRAKGYLHHDGEVAVIDFNGSGMTFGHHWTEKAVIEHEMEAAGYRLKKEFSFLQYQSFLIFCRAEDAQCTAGAQLAGAAAQ